jgi:hypothetical protein
MALSYAISLGQLYKKVGHSMNGSVYFTMLFFLGGSSLSGQALFEPELPRKTVTAVYIEDELIIDGKLDEGSWQLPGIATGFFQIYPVQGAPLSSDTEVRLLYNKKYLYVSAICRFTDGKKNLRAPSFQRDHEEGSHDNFGVAIDGFNDERNAIAFITDPWSTQRDLLSFDDQQYDVEWDGLWKVRTTRHDSSWIAEMAIPWETLRYSKAASQEWGIQFFRLNRFINEGSTWSPMPRAYATLRMAYAGKIDNIQPPPPSPNIRIQPYILAASGQYQNSDQRLKDSQSLKVGGEIKWALNTNSVLDLTFNTDFAQADVDRQVNNVTRFNVFFPERRQFFLENASLFGAGLAPIEVFAGGSMRIHPFFSRRIGLDDAGNPIPIRAGGRYVHRSSKRNFGAMAIRLESGNDMHGENFFIGRYSENIGRQNRLGALVTSRLGGSASDAVTGALDGFFRLNQKLSFTFMGIANENPQEENATSFAGYARVYHLSNNLIAYWTQSYVPDNFNPVAGFVSRRNVIATTPGFYFRHQYRWLPKFIRFSEPGLYVEVYHKASTRDLQEASININPVWLAFQSGGGFGYFTFLYRQNIDEVFTPLDITIAPGDYRYVRHKLYYFSDKSKKVSWTLNYDFGDYYDRDLSYYEGTLRIAPRPHTSFTLSYGTNTFTNVGENTERKSISLYSIESRLALNPRVQLISFYQRNTSGNRGTWNVRFAWEFKPLSFVYLIFNNRAFETTERQSEQHLIAKLSYLKQF